MSGIRMVCRISSQIKIGSTLWLSSFSPVFFPHPLPIKISCRTAVILYIGIHLHIRTGIVKPVDGIMKRVMHGNGEGERLHIGTGEAV